MAASSEVPPTPLNNSVAETTPAAKPLGQTKQPGTAETKAAAALADEVALAELRRTAPRKLLEIAGIDSSQLRPLQDGWPLGDNVLEITLKLLYRIRRFGHVDTTLWSHPNAPLMLMANHPADYRLQMYALRGRVVEVNEEQPPQEMVERYDFQKYYSCLVELEDSHYPVKIVTPSIPKQWDLTKPIEEPISAQAMFIKVGERRGDLMQLVFLAPRIAWHPNKVQGNQNEQSVNFGMTELGRLGMDVGLFDSVQNREGITERDREAFYQLLAAVERAPQNQLARIAMANLPELQKVWHSEIASNSQALVEQRAALKAFKGSATEKEKLSERVKATTRRVAVLQKAEKDAQQGHYSVYPLFNLADEQHGQLVFLEGVARRAIKVELANPRDPNSNRDIIERFGIDHYYELAIFTEDSGDNPIIICVRELPTGFPTGSALNEAVRVACFFFKTWAFYTTEGVNAKEQNPPVPRRQLAPLLIARAPIWVKDEPLPADSSVAATIGTVFVVLMMLAAFSVWRFNRRDEAFRKNVMARKYDIDSGMSLNDAGLVTVDGPDFSHLGEEGNATGEAVVSEIPQAGDSPNTERSESKF
jgi:hypothetical protein